MTWLSAITELCHQLEGENTIREVLNTATDEGMITYPEAEEIARHLWISLDNSKL